MSSAATTAADIAIDAPVEVTFVDIGDGVVLPDFRRADPEPSR